MSTQETIPKVRDQAVEEIEEMPAKWKRLPLKQMIADGWKPRIKKAGTIRYLLLRKGNKDRSLGQYSDAKLDFLCTMFPSLREMDIPSLSRQDSTILSTRLGTPLALTSRFFPTMKTLRWYEWAQEKGFTGKLSDFINEIVHDYFSEQGLELVVLQTGTG